MIASLLVTLLWNLWLRRTVVRAVGIFSLCPWFGDASRQPATSEGRGR